MNSVTSTSTQRLTVLTEDDGVPGSRFDQEPDNYTVDQLKRWLKCRGLKQSGKRNELLARVKACIDARNHRILDVSIDEGKWFSAKVLKESSKDSVDGIKQTNSNQRIPHVPSNGWNTFQSQDIPAMFNYGHIHYYALESLQVENIDEENDYRMGHMTDKPLKNGRKYVDSDFIHDVMDATTEEHYFARAHVWPSMRSDLPHNVLVILSNISGSVIHGSCEPCKVSALGRCSHVISLLLFLDEHVKKNGAKVNVPCTSKPCSWNKGKKRSKNPQRLSAANYPPKVKKSSTIDLIDFDPRPNTRQHVSTESLNEFIRGLNDISSQNTNASEVSMWETVLEYSYKDYNFDDEKQQLLIENVCQLKANLTPEKTQEIQGTREQSSSDQWFCERFWRLTASKCLDACRIAKLIRNNDKNAAVKAMKFINSNVWKMDPEEYTTTYMKYGLESEPKAINKYQDQIGAQVLQTGLWVNPQFPFLACSPDGLIASDGLIEIKSLKLFKENTIDSVISGDAAIVKDVMGRQCFVVKNGKCQLKRTHQYYYQIQMQLLVTERQYCDFVLYAEEGPVSIERIYPDPLVTQEIIQDLTLFWDRVIAPEFFEMRVPRRLKPFILLKETVVIPPEASSKITTPENKEDETVVIHPEAPSKIATPENKEYDEDNDDDEPPYYDVLADVSLNNAIDLQIIPWGGTLDNGIVLTNTCTIDNWLMIFQALVKSNRIDLLDLAETGQQIGIIMSLIEQDKFADAKIAVIDQPRQTQSTFIDFYGNEDDYFIKLLRPYLLSEVTTVCRLNTCPCATHTYTSCTVNLGKPASMTSNTVLLDSIHLWIKPDLSMCKRKFQSKPLDHNAYTEDVTIDDQGKSHPLWHCSGYRECPQGRILVNLKNIIIFSVDLLSGDGLKVSQVPSSIEIYGKVFTFYAATLWNGGHYIGMFQLRNGWALYDGLKENQTKNTGITYSSHVHDEPQGYILSYLVFCV